jgi:hypothetical protein
LCHSPGLFSAFEKVSAYRLSVSVQRLSSFSSDVEVVMFFTLRVGITAENEILLSRT